MNSIKEFVWLRADNAGADGDESPPAIRMIREPAKRSRSARSSKDTNTAASRAASKGAEFFYSIKKEGTVHQMQLHRERVAGKEVLAWVMEMVLEQRIVVLADGDLAAGLEIDLDRVAVVADSQRLRFVGNLNLASARRRAADDPG
jgi:hypothetical protein